MAFVTNIVNRCTDIRASTSKFLNCEKGVFMRQLLLSFTLAVVVLGSTLLVGCGSATSSGSKTAQAAPRVASVTIPQDQEVFSPFILTVQPNTVVTWQNNDTIVKYGKKMA